MRFRLFLCSAVLGLASLHFSGCRLGAPRPAPDTPATRESIRKRLENETCLAVLADINSDTRLKTRSLVVKTAATDAKQEGDLLRGPLKIESPKLPAIGLREWMLDHFALVWQEGQDIAQIACPEPHVGAACDFMLIESAVFAEQSAERAYRVAEKALPLNKRPKSWLARGLKVEAIEGSYDGREDINHPSSWKFSFRPHGEATEKPFQISVETRNYTIAWVSESEDGPKS